MSNETPMITQKKWNAKLRELRVANERIAAMTAERDGLQQSLIAEEDEYVKLLAECEDLKHDIARHVDIASKEASARIEAEARLATVRAETIEECAKVCDPNGMSAEEYCKISNYVIQRDIQRDIALMKNLAEAIRALKEGE